VGCCCVVRLASLLLLGGLLRTTGVSSQAVAAAAAVGAVFGILACSFWWLGWFGGLVPQLGFALLGISAAVLSVIWHCLKFCRGIGNYQPGNRTFAICPQNLEIGFAFRPSGSQHIVSQHGFNRFCKK